MCQAKCQGFQVLLRCVLLKRSSEGTHRARNVAGSPKGAAPWALRPLREPTGTQRARSGPFRGLLAHRRLGGGRAVLHGCATGRSHRPPYASFSPANTGDRLRASNMLNARLLPLVERLVDLTHQSPTLREHLARQRQPHGAHHHDPSPGREACRTANADVGHGLLRRA